MKRAFWWLGALSVIVASCDGGGPTASPSAAVSAAEIVEAVRRFYAGIDSVALSFECTYTVETSVVTRGTLAFRRPRRYRVEVNSPLAVLEIANGDVAFERLPADGLEYSRVDPSGFDHSYGLLVDPMSHIAASDVTVVAPPESDSTRLRIRLDPRSSADGRPASSTTRWTIDVVWSGERRGQVAWVERAAGEVRWTCEVESGSFERNPAVSDDVFLFRPPPGAIDVTADRVTPERERALDAAEHRTALER